MREKFTFILNAEDAFQKRDAAARLGRLTNGKYEVTVKPISDTRSLNANRYWWSCVVEPFRHYNAEQGEPFTQHQCHEILKRELLPVKMIPSRVTGEMIDVLAETKNMSREEFGDLIERAIVYLAEIGIAVPDPYQYGGLRKSA